MAANMNSCTQFRMPMYNVAQRRGQCSSQRLLICARVPEFDERGQPRQGVYNVAQPRGVYNVAQPRDVCNIAEGHVQCRSERSLICARVPELDERGQPH
eukprot:1232924-Rhodomonas_salina.1